MGLVKTRRLAAMQKQQPFHTVRNLARQERVQTMGWAEHGMFCIEDAAILNDHGSSWIAEYLLAEGFTEDTPSGYHRVGPWMWVDTNGMTFRYHPRWGAGIGTPIGAVALTGRDFMSIWEVMSMRKKINASIAGGWEGRIRAQEELPEER